MWYLILFLFLVYYLLMSTKNNENYISRYNRCYETVDCSKKKKKIDKCIFPFRGEWTKCGSDTRNAGEKCYKCPWKRPGLDLKSTSHCCQNKCNNVKVKPTGIPYYCKDYQVCIKKYANSPKERVCGLYMLYNTPAKIYNTLNECNNDVLPYIHLNKEQCLNTTDAGWCTDYLGKGVCVSGTPVGPTDTVRFDTCFPNQITNKNSWTPGYLDSSMVLRNAYI